jgi:hypothetical protein
MTMVSFDESGMTFGPYDEDYCFRVEVSDTYRAIQHKVQMAEFLLLRTQIDSPPSVWIVEAKQSSPRPETQPNFNEFILEIRDKLANALTVVVASILQRHPSADAELPSLFKTLDLSKTEFRLILIINGHKKEWLKDLQDALRSALHSISQTWALSPNAVVVINHEAAKRSGLISAP